MLLTHAALCHSASSTGKRVKIKGKFWTKPSLKKKYRFIEFKPLHYIAIIEVV